MMHQPVMTELQEQYAAGKPLSEIAWENGLNITQTYEAIGIPEDARYPREVLNLMDKILGTEEVHLIKG
jgi:hypothetical protein